MARSNRTSNVLKLLNLPEAERPSAVLPVVENFDAAVGEQGFYVFGDVGWVALDGAQGGVFEKSCEGVRDRSHEGVLDKSHEGVLDKSYEELPDKVPDKSHEEVPDKTPENATAPAEITPKKRRRRAIVKHMKLEKLSEAGGENPALKAIAELAESAEPAEPIDPNKPTKPAPEKAFVAAPPEAKAPKQIVSIPLLLVNEQLGAAVERFNVCACDACLRGISDRALDLMPPMYFRLTTAEDADEVNRLMRERRAEAIRTLAKVCIVALSKPFHGDGDD